MSVISVSDAPEIEQTAVNREAAVGTTIVFGIGATGRSVARFLLSRGESFVTVDSRENPEGLEEFEREFELVTVLCGDLDEKLLSGCERIILSPGVPRYHPLIKKALSLGISVIGDIELFQQYADAPIIAITGSNGKSSVVTMVADILRAAKFNAFSGGNIGRPALDLLEEQHVDYYVLELSSFQLESIENFRPQVACILNISPDHMDRYPDFKTYADVKRRIYRNAEHVVLFADDDVIGKQSELPKAVYFSAKTECKANYRLDRTDGETILRLQGGDEIEASELSVVGVHNYINALAAIAITDQLGIERVDQRAALRTFQGLPHRCQLIATAEGVEWIDDSKGTNVGATKAAIEGLMARRASLASINTGDHAKGILIAGGVGKGADFAQLRDPLERYIRAVILIGRDAHLIADAIMGVADIHFASDMDDAVDIAVQLVQAGDKVLLSPACASFDMFENYMARGESFQRSVLAKVNAGPVQ